MTRNTQNLPVLVVGAGPIGLMTALGLSTYELPFAVFEEDDSFSSDTKAGTILTRTLEIFRRYGVADAVLARSLRIDEIGSIDRESNTARHPIHTRLMRDETRYPFVVNLPQHHLEPVLAQALQARAPGTVHTRHRLTGFTQHADHVEAEFDTPDGPRKVKGSYLLACDGGRSTVRDKLGIEVEGMTLDVRYMLVDLKVDLDVENARDYPYLAYFSDPQEWMILVRQPHCWRFLFPLPLDQEEASEAELLAKVRRFIGEAKDVEMLGKVIYRVHHRVADTWQLDRVLLMGDAAHLITPMWALGMNTGALDAHALPWRLAWVLRGWAPPALLQQYEREQRPIAVNGSGQLAEAARIAMSQANEAGDGPAAGDWGNACTRMLLGVQLDLSGQGGGNMTRNDSAPPPLCAGDRMPDWELHGAEGRALRAHELADGCFAALYFTDVRRRPRLPAADSPALRHYVVSRWDAPFDSGLRERALLDIGDALRTRLGHDGDVLVLMRPDDHIAAIVPLDTASPEQAAALYERAVGAPPPAATHAPASTGSDATAAPRSQPLTGCPA